MLLFRPLVALGTNEAFWVQPNWIMSIKALTASRIPNCPTISPPWHMSQIHKSQMANMCTSHICLTVTLVQHGSSTIDHQFQENSHFSSDKYESINLLGTLLSNVVWGPIWRLLISILLHKTLSEPLQSFLGSSGSWKWAKTLYFPTWIGSWGAAWGKNKAF